MKSNKRILEEYVFLSSFIVIALIIFLGIVGTFKGSLIGKAIEQASFQNVNLYIDANTSYMWAPEQKVLLGSLCIAGSFEGDSVSVYFSDIPLYKFGYDKARDVEIVKEGSGEISLDFTYGNSSGYDNNNDGISGLDNVIDFNVNSNFNFDSDYSKVCTKYSINNLD